MHRPSSARRRRHGRGVSIAQHSIAVDSYAEMKA
ncbi:hypothetical protein E5Q_05503 [Mixia osmundae IAM 14324]|uniref:Uncharacterized protein n=1 Tax=Mixia osmundae (strain CBS 9802 / IAM 14324 / JCM 22182 / KY 12970) TaxID=764103 RepID=G7E7K5_MIXOS|nr:hypothetical protein E5Q_05503 [Mixia osmundae IAM 14324]